MFSALLERELKWALMSATDVSRVVLYVSSGSDHTSIIFLHPSRIQASDGTMARHSALSSGTPLGRMPVLTYTTLFLNIVIPFQSLEGQFKLSPQWSLPFCETMVFETSQIMALVVLSSWFYCLSFNTFMAWPLKLIKCCLPAGNCVLNVLKYTIVASEVLPSDLFFLSLSISLAC